MTNSDKKLIDVISAIDKEKKSILKDRFGRNKIDLSLVLAFVKLNTRDTLQSIQRDYMKILDTDITGYKKQRIEALKYKASEISRNIATLNTTIEYLEYLETLIPDMINEIDYQKKQKTHYMTLFETLKLAYQTADSESKTFVDILLTLTKKK